MSWTDGSPHDQTGNMGMPEIEVILAVDLSGSMSGTPVRKARDAMINFVNQMDEGVTKIGVLAFADKTKMVIELTNDLERVKKAIEGIQVGEVGICNYAEPFTLSRDILCGGIFRKKKDTIKYLVVLTDGIWENTKSAIRQAKQCHRQEIEVMALGFGNADYGFLRQIASIDDFAALTNLSDLSGSFSKIAQTIGEGTTSSGLRMR